VENEVLTNTTSPSLAVDPTDRSSVDASYEFVANLSLERGVGPSLELARGQQPSLQDDDNGNTQKDAQKIVGEEEQSNGSPKNNDCRQCNGSDEPVTKGSKVEGKADGSDELVTKGSEVEGKGGVEDDVLLLDGPSVNDQVPKN